MEYMAGVTHVDSIVETAYSHNMSEIWSYVC